MSNPCCEHYSLDSYDGQCGDPAQYMALYSFVGQYPNGEQEARVCEYHGLDALSEGHRLETFDGDSVVVVDGDLQVQS